MNSVAARASPLSRFSSLDVEPSSLLKRLTKRRWTSLSCCFLFFCDMGPSSSMAQRRSLVKMTINGVAAMALLCTSEEVNPVVRSRWQNRRLYSHSRTSISTRRSALGIQTSIQSQGTYVLMQNLSYPIGAPKPGTRRIQVHESRTEGLELEARVLVAILSGSAAASKRKCLRN